MWGGEFLGAVFRFVPDVYIYTACNLEVQLS